jgi:hypothetical protein
MPAAYNYNVSAKRTLTQNCYPKMINEAEFIPYSEIKERFLTICPLHVTTTNKNLKYTPHEINSTYFPVFTDVRADRSRKPK